MLFCLTSAALINTGELHGGGGSSGSGEEGPSVEGMCVFMGDWVGLRAAWLFVSLGSLHNEVVYSAAPSFQLPAGLSAQAGGGGLSHHHLPPALLPTLALSLCFSFWLKITKPLHPIPLPHTQTYQSHVW